MSRTAAEERKGEVCVCARARARVCVCVCVLEDVGFGSVAGGALYNICAYGRLRVRIPH